MSVPINWNRGDTEGEMQKHCFLMTLKQPRCYSGQEECIWTDGRQSQDSAGQKQEEKGPAIIYLVEMTNLNFQAGLAVGPSTVNIVNIVLLMNRNSQGSWISITLPIVGII